MTLRIRRRDMDAVLAHAIEGAPNEVVGILSGRKGAVERVLRGDNVAADPRVRYELDPRQQFAIMTELDDRGEEMVGIYHSHPFSPAYPSRIDLEMAHYPESVYVIVSLMETKTPVARAFLIDGSRIDEVKIEIEETPDR